MGPGPWFNPFDQLASTAAKIAADTWTAVMLSLWNAGLWLLRLILSWMDAWLTPDLSDHGPGHDLYQATFWVAGVVMVIMMMIQLGIAGFRRDGKSLARALVGVGQFAIVTAGWIGYTVAFTAAMGGLTHALMESLLNVTSWGTWEPFEPFDVKTVTDGGMATVLGLMGLLMWIAAIGHLVVILARDAMLMVLVATGPITAAGLANETTRVWFWKALRWFHAAAATPVMVVLVTGVGVKFAERVAAGKAGSVQAAAGTAIPAIILICIAVFAPVALFKLLAFVEPGTASGAAMRAGMAAVGGVQGLLQGNPTAGATAGADPSGSGDGQSSGESSADAATTARVSGAVQQGGAMFGPVGAALAMGLGAMSKVGTVGAAVLSDAGNQEGVGNNTYQPDYQGNSGGAAARASREANASNDAGDPDTTAAGGDPAGNTPSTSPAPSAAPPAGSGGGSGGSGASGGGSGGGGSGGGSGGGGSGGAGAAGSRAAASEAAEVAVVAL